MLRRAEQMLLEASGEVKSKRCEIRVCTVRFLVLRYKKLKNDVDIVTVEYVPFARFGICDVGDRGTFENV